MTRITLLLAGLVVLVASAASGQDAPRAVSGRVFDDSTGCPLKGARLAASTGASDAAVQSAFFSTDANGRYRAVNPPAGPFSLRVTLAGYTPQQVDGVTVTDSTARIDFTLFRVYRDGSTQAVYPKAACRLEPRDSL
jgi:Carboxypeptidase regulatory-like domain